MTTSNWILIALVIVGSAGGLLVGWNWGYGERGTECNQFINALNTDWQAKTNAATIQRDNDWQIKMNAALNQKDSDWQTRLANETSALNANWQARLNGELNRLNNDWQVRLNTETASSYWSGDSNGYSRGLRDGFNRCVRCPPPPPPAPKSGCCG